MHPLLPGPYKFSYMRKFPYKLYILGRTEYVLVAWRVKEMKDRLKQRKMQLKLDGFVIFGSYMSLYIWKEKALATSV